MKTIQLISSFVSKMKEINLPANIEIGSFKVNSKGSLSNWFGRTGEFEGCNISFRLNFLTIHIQKLKEMGVKIDLNEVKMSNLSEKALRYKKGRDAIKQGRYAPYYYMGNPENNQTGIIENWLETSATCSLSTLENLDKFCRENHRNELAIHNTTVLTTNGWKIKEHFSSKIKESDLFFNVKSFRKNIADKKKKSFELLPIEKRALNIN